MNLNDFDPCRTLQPQQVTLDVLAEKYAKGSETTADEIFLRVAKGVAQAEAPEYREHWAAAFFANMRAGAIGAGRIMSAAGTEIRATLANCFVQPIGDAIQGVDEQGLPGIYEALREAAETMRRGGGVGYDFSRIRPRGARVKGTHSSASGPCTYMDVFDVSCGTVESAGARRGAQMGVLRIDHPDVMEFIGAKSQAGRWTNFNVSVGVVAGFMEAVERGGPWELVHRAEPCADQLEEGAFQRSDGQWVYRTVPAREIWAAVMRGTYESGEPGILFLDNMNRDNNLRYVETIEATNPCGEQPLPAYGCCDLGPIILPMFVREAFTPQAFFDADSFERSVAVQVRFLDNVLDVTHWPLEEQQRESQSKRRIGVGFTGLGNVLTMLGIRYDSDKGRSIAVSIARRMRNAAYNASVELAKEKGAFPLFDAARYLEAGTFASRLPDHIKASIRAHGIRNSHLLSIAPTGTVSLAFADNASGGIEPAFSLAYDRKKRQADGTKATYSVKDHAYRRFITERCEPRMAEALDAAVRTYKPTFQLDGVDHAVHDVLGPGFVSALEMSADDHLQMVAAVQPFIDTSISKTVNVPEDYPFADFEDLYLQAWKAGLKGLATYRPNALRGSVLSVGATPTATSLASNDDPLTKHLASRPDGELQGVTSKVQYLTHEGNQSVYLVVNFADVEGVIGGQKVTIERPLEFFMPASQSGEGQQWISSNMRLLSMVARSGGSIAKALANMREVVWDKPPVRCGTVQRSDGTLAPRFHGSEVAALGFALQNILIRRGFLDEGGLQIPVSRLVARRAEAHRPSTASSADEHSPMPTLRPGSGKCCPTCGAHDLHKIDGCDKCTNCGHVGACG